MAMCPYNHFLMSLPAIKGLMTAALSGHSAISFSCALPSITKACDAEDVAGPRDVLSHLSAVIGAKPFVWRDEHLHSAIAEQLERARVKYDFPKYPAQNLWEHFRVARAETPLILHRNDRILGQTKSWEDRVSGVERREVCSAAKSAR